MCGICGACEGCYPSTKNQMRERAGREKFRGSWFELKPPLCGLQPCGFLLEFRAASLLDDRRVVHGVVSSGASLPACDGLAEKW